MRWRKALAILLSTGKNDFSRIHAVDCVLERCFPAFQLWRCRVVPKVQCACGSITGVPCGTQLMKVIALNHAWLSVIPLAGLSLGSQPCIAQSAADGPCSSLRAGVKQLAARTAGTAFSGSYTVFDALLDELGFTEEFVLSLDARAVLIPSDEAFAKFFQKFTEAEVAPLQYVKLNSDVFKQVRVRASR